MGNIALRRGLTPYLPRKYATVEPTFVSPLLLTIALQLAIRKTLKLRSAIACVRFFRPHRNENFHKKPNAMRRSRRRHIVCLPAEMSFLAHHITRRRRRRDASKCRREARSPYLVTTKTELKKREKKPRMCVWICRKTIEIRWAVEERVKMIDERNGNGYVRFCVSGSHSDNERDSFTVC